MQDYAPLTGSEKLTDSMTTLNANDQTIMSQNSGTAFPTTNLQVGMSCYRTDLQKTYVLDTITPSVSWIIQGGGASDAGSVSVATIAGLTATDVQAALAGVARRRWCADGKS